MAETTLIEPISRKLNRLGKFYLSVLTKNVGHLDIDRYFYVLTLIHHYDGTLTQNALAQLLDKDKSAMVSILDTLTEKGYVYREINPADRRQHLLKVTDKAKKDVPELITAFEELNNSISNNIPEDELRIFYSVLQKMYSNIKPLVEPQIINPKP